MFDFIKKKIKKTPESFLTFATILAAAQVNYAIAHNSFVYIALFIIFVHELGHYFVAKYHGAKVRLPIFIPLPFLVIAFTKVSKLNAHATKQVSLYGPLFGAITALLFLMLNGIFHFMSYIPLLVLLSTEILFNYFGTDGKKYRKAKKDLQTCIL